MKIAKITNQIPWLLGLVVGLINLARGLGHLLSQDSDAGAAGISLNTASAPDIIYLFAIIGGGQVILALFYLYVALFNRKLLPVSLIMEVAKTSLYLYVGYIFKPSRATVVVGSKQDQLQLALSLLALFLIGLPYLAQTFRRKADQRAGS